MGDAANTSGEWFCDSDEGVDIQEGTPKSKIIVTPTASGGSTPDSPASCLWDYSLPVVDEKTRVAANKLALGIRKWRQKRRLLVKKSPTVHLRNACYRKKLCCFDNQENLEPFCDSNVGCSMLKVNESDLMSEIKKCDKERLSLGLGTNSVDNISKLNKNEEPNGISKPEEETISKVASTCTDQESLLNDSDDDLFLKIDMQSLTQT